MDSTVPKLRSHSLIPEEDSESVGNDPKKSKASSEADSTKKSRSHSTKHKHRSHRGHVTTRKTESLLSKPSVDSQVVQSSESTPNSTTTNRTTTSTAHSTSGSFSGQILAELVLTPEAQENLSRNQQDYLPMDRNEPHISDLVVTGHSTILIEEPIPIDHLRMNNPDKLVRVVKCQINVRKNGELEVHVPGDKAMSDKLQAIFKERFGSPINPNTKNLSNLKTV